jgi:hypothetical protein
MLLTLPIPGLDLPEWMNVPPPVSSSPFQEFHYYIKPLLSYFCMSPTTLLKLHLSLFSNAFSSQLVVITGSAKHNGDGPLCRGPILVVHGLRSFQTGARVLPLQKAYKQGRHRRYQDSDANGL